MDIASWKLLDSALDYYESIGYVYVDAPWECSTRIAELTTPVNKPSFKENHVLVGSAEQSLLEMYINRELSSNLPYVAMTPCYRIEDKYDELHQSCFMKIELFQAFSGMDESAVVHEKESGSLYQYLMCEARSFMKNYGNVDEVQTEIGHDLMINGIEVGSYGFREVEFEGLKYHYIYGTGLAEPRFSLALQKD